MNKEKALLHEGHRQRIKRKVRRMGLKNFEEHEILELLLTYCIPRRDTNSLAHNLIKKFGSLNNVVQADEKQLKSVEGVGDETALFLNVLHDFVTYYLENSPIDLNGSLNTTSKLVAYFRSHYMISKNEFIIGLLLSKNYSILNHFVVEGDCETDVVLKVESLADYISQKNVKYLVLFHTHPGGVVMPSDADIEATRRILYMCSPFGVVLKEHIILNEFIHYSFDKEGLLDKIRKNAITRTFNKGENLLKVDK